MLLVLRSIMTHLISIQSICGEFAIHTVLGEVSSHSTIEHPLSTGWQVLAPSFSTTVYRAPTGYLVWNKWSS